MTATFEGADIARGAFGKCYGKSASEVINKSGG